MAKKKKHIKQDPLRKIREVEIFRNRVLPPKKPKEPDINEDWE